MLGVLLRDIDTNKLVEGRMPFIAPYTNCAVISELDITKALEMLGKSTITYTLKDGSGDMSQYKELIFCGEETSVIDTTPVKSSIITEEGKAITVYKVIRQNAESRHFGESTFKRFSEVIEELLIPVINKNVVIEVPHCKIRELPGVKTKFYIFIWSTPLKGRTYASFDVPIPQTLWGINNMCSDGGISNSGLGVPIICDEGYIFGELFPNAFYIHNDLCNTGLPEEVLIFKRAIKEILPYFDEEKREGFVNECKERLRMLIKESLCKAFLSNFDSNLKRQEQLGEDYKSSIDSHYREIIEKTKKLNFLNITIDALKKTRPQQEQFVLVEIERLQKNKKITNFYTEDVYLNVFTKKLYIKERKLEKPDYVYYVLGEYKIQINMINGDIKFYNLTNKGKGPGYTRPSGFAANTDYNRHHPHIPESGHPCLGNIKTVIPKYLVENRISIIVDLLIQFLETVNVDDVAGKGIFWWPYVETLPEE